jgi:hypothetical protein
MKGSWWPCNVGWAVIALTQPLEYVDGNVGLSKQA